MYVYSIGALNAIYMNITGVSWDSTDFKILSKCSIKLTGLGKNFRSNLMFDTDFFCMHTVALNILSFLI